MMRISGHSWLDSKWTYTVLVIAVLALRVPHLAGPIDDPHSWRQSDTAYYALDFYRNGFHLLRPQVCWSGEHGVLALEFPLPEALTALLYRLLGFNHLWGRLVTLAFYAGSLLYLLKIVQKVGTHRLGRLAALVYGLLPLSIYYSRAIHVDFAAIFFGHAMLYHMLRGFDGSDVRHILAGAAMGGLGFAIKAPYLFYLYLPLGVFLVNRQVWRNKRPFYLLSLAVPIAAFLLWRWNVGLVNADKPALDIYPKFVERWEWYFGTLAQRLDVANWLVLLHRLIWDIANPIGFLLLAWGIYGWLRSRQPVMRWFFESWALGTIVYLLVFFNLNWIHNYYQIPMLSIVSVAIAACLDRFAALKRPYGALAVAALVLLLAAASLWYTGVAYYHIDWRAVRAGQLIQEHSAPDDLVVVYLYDDNDDNSDPRLLYRALRRGWSIRPSDIEQQRLTRYANEGGRLLAIVETEPDLRLRPAWLAELPAQHLQLEHQGQHLGTLHLYDLGPFASP